MIATRVGASNFASPFPQNLSLVSASRTASVIGAEAPADQTADPRRGAAAGGELRQAAGFVAPSSRVSPEPFLYGAATR